MPDVPPKPGSSRGRPAAWSAAVVAAVVTLGLTALVVDRAEATSSAAPATRSSGHVVPMAAAPTGTAAQPTGGTAGAAGTGPSQVATSPGASGSAGATRLPAQAIAPAQLPHSTGESWSAGLLEPLHALAGHSVELNECAQVAHALTWQQRAYQGSAGDSAIEETYTFSSSTAAASAYAAITAGMDGCQNTSRTLQSANGITPDAVVVQTATAPNAAAFERRWTGVQGVSAAGPQTNHLYAAVRGSTLVVLHFDEFSAHPAYDVGADPAVLRTLATALAP